MGNNDKRKSNVYRGVNMKITDQLKDRVDREREWHDKRFHNDNRNKSTERFYLALRNWYGDYDKKCLSANCGSALELGAGLESVSLSYDIPFRLTSIDISSKAIELLKSKGVKENISFEVADAHDLPYANGSFNFVFARGVLHHLDLQVALPEILRILGQPHKILFGEPLAGNPFIRLYRWLTPHLRTPDEQPLCHKDILHLRNAFPGAKIKYYGFFSLIYALLTNRHSSFANNIDNIILNKLRLGRFLAWTCIISN